eukprot:COSAG04_NODE_1433_length_6791_cov_2.044082_2_plen_341_part_00
MGGGGDDCEGANIAEDSQSVAMGWANRASAESSVAMGWGNHASGDTSVSMGKGNHATGPQAVAMGGGDSKDGANDGGNGNTASGYASVAMGARNHATGGAAAAIGYGNLAVGDTSVAMGDTNQANGTSSVVCGSHVANAGDYSIANGLHFQLADNTTEAIATSGEMYAKKFNVVASRELATDSRATDGAKQLRSLLELPVHEFSPSDDYCISRSEGTGTASHQQCTRTRHTGIFAEDAGKVFPADRTVVQSAGTYHLHEPNGQRNRLSSVENAGTIDVAQLQAISIATIQEQQRQIEKQQRVIEEQQHLIGGLQRMGKEQQEMMAQMQAAIDRLKPTAVP